MNQSASIVVFLLIGFVVWVVIKGEIPQYKAAIVGATATAPSS